MSDAFLIEAEECHKIRAESEACRGRLTLASLPEERFGMPTEEHVDSELHRRLRDINHTPQNAHTMVWYHRRTLRPIMKGVDRWESLATSPPASSFMTASVLFSMKACWIGVESYPLIDTFMANNSRLFCFHSMYVHTKGAVWVTYICDINLIDSIPCQWAIWCSISRETQKSVSHF